MKKDNLFEQLLKEVSTMKMLSEIAEKIAKANTLEEINSVYDKYIEWRNSYQLKKSECSPLLIIAIKQLDDFLQEKSTAMIFKDLLEKKLGIKFDDNKNKKDENHTFEGGTSSSTSDSVQPSSTSIKK